MAIAMHGKSKAMRREHNSRAWLAWHVAALQRAKRMPTLRSMLAKEKPRAQSWQEQLEVMRSYAATHNARVKRLSDG